MSELFLFSEVYSETMLMIDSSRLDKMRAVGDPEADRIIENIIAAGCLREFYYCLSLTKGDMVQQKTLHDVQQFLLRTPELPSWFNEEQFERGQRFFQKYALEVMGLLGALSLPYCYAATPGNKAIYLTEKMRKAPGKRLLETAHFIIEVMKEGAFRAEGSGFFEVQKTRLIHSLVRNFVRYKTQWDEAWGVPVNQEDMAGTNLAFSFIILRGMEQSEFPLSERDKEDYLYAWRFIGFQLRIDEALLATNMREAAELEELIRLRHFRKSEEGPLLTTELINHYKESFPAVASYFVDSQIRYFIGPEVSGLLGLRPQPFKDSIVEFLNRIRKYFNRKFVNPFSYRIMIRNHFKLKKKYSTVP